MSDAEFCLMMEEVWRQHLAAEAKAFPKLPAPTIPVGSEPPPASRPERQYVYRQIMEGRGIKFVPNTLGKQAMDKGASAAVALGLVFVGTFAGCLLLGPFGVLGGPTALGVAALYGLKKTRKRLTIA
jgi:hypothetical protein